MWALAQRDGEEKKEEEDRKKKETTGQKYNGPPLLHRVAINRQKIVNSGKETIAVVTYTKSEISSACHELSNDGGRKVLSLGLE